MSTATTIQWTDKTWNPIRGCSLVSPGCTNCYAMRQAHRFSGPGSPYAGLTRITTNGPVWNGRIRLVPEALDEPLRWRRPSRVFVDSMSDLFHEKISTDFLDQVFAVMALAKEHTFQVLTKRPTEAKRYLETKDPCCLASAAPEEYPCSSFAIEDRDWPLPNVWLGVSVENQKTADERTRLLELTPAAVRFLSVEPLLEAVDLELVPKQSDDIGHRVDWVIVGGESGPHARPCNVDWIRSVIEQCRAARVPVFVKQLGANVWFGATQYGPASPKYIRDRKGGDPAEWPEDLRVRDYPECERLRTRGLR